MAIITFIFSIIFLIVSIRRNSSPHRFLAFSLFVATVGMSFINYVALSTMVSAGFSF